MKLELLVLAAVAACSGGSAPEGPKQAPARARRDAGAPGITKITGFDPASGMHLDDDTPHSPQPAVVHPAHAGHPIDVTLRSTPPGAQVMVDGTPVGSSPTFWSGQADGSPHEFTFMLPGHAVARYRFVPVTSGVIHARLEPVTEEPDAGVDDDGTTGAPVPAAGAVLVNPPPAPVAKPDAPAVAPPPTVVSPDAAPTPAPPGLGPQP
ncbi:MAG: PEGA domain-containing protein [Acidobacteriota bacterium]